MSHNDEINEEFEESLDQRFMNLYPDYDYSNKNKSELESAFGTRVSDLVKYTYLKPEPKMPNIYFTLSFVSLLSFLAGYKFHNLIQN